MTAAALARVRQLAADAPPLTEAQEATIRAALRGGAR